MTPPETREQTTDAVQGLREALLGAVTESEAEDSTPPETGEQTTDGVQSLREALLGTVTESEAGSSSDSDNPPAASTAQPDEDSAPESGALESLRKALIGKD